jgi:hypothetical protein
MGLIDRIDRGGDLMAHMADTVGADLGAALMSGTLSAEALRGAVVRCSRCEAADFCESWLEVKDAHKAEDGIAPQPPEFCANRDLMERLGA